MIDKWYFRIALLFFSTIIGSCSCDEQLKCPAISDEAKTMLTNLLGNGLNLTYQNTSGDQYEFTYKNYLFTPEAIIDANCERKGAFPGECECGNFCFAYGKIWYFSSTPIDSFKTLEYDVSEIRDDFTPTFRRSFSFKIFDFSGYYSEESIYGFPGHSVIDSMEFGGNSYEHVHLFEVDTTMQYTSDQNIWKVYFTFSDGVIGFYKKSSPEMYLRQ